MTTSNTGKRAKIHKTSNFIKFRSKKDKKKLNQYKVFFPLRISSASHIMKLSYKWTGITLKVDRFQIFTTILLKQIHSKS